MNETPPTGYRSCLEHLVGRFRIPPGHAAEAAGPDPRDGRIYEPTDDLLLAAEVALVTGRPLLIRGVPGSGKSSFAPWLARVLGWRYFEHVVTARTEARDLLWTYDALARLRDAQAGGGRDLDEDRYVRPGALWWAIDPETATAHAKDRPVPAWPAHGVTQPETDRAVVLIDEIDKADPDVPNDLLVPLGSLRFEVRETGRLVEHRRSAEIDPHGMRAPLVIITTNEERTLPAAFLRRCVTTRLDHPDAARLASIGRLHLQDERGRDLAEDADALVTSLAHRVATMRAEATAVGRRPPSTAEYLDALRACLELGIAPGDDDEAEPWRTLRRVALDKADDSATEADPRF